MDEIAPPENVSLHHPSVRGWMIRKFTDHQGDYAGKLSMPSGDVICVYRHFHSLGYQKGLYEAAIIEKGDILTKVKGHLSPESVTDFILSHTEA